MYLLTLNIECHEIGVKKTMQFEPRTLVHDACRMVRDKLDPLSGNPNDYGLFRVEDDQTKCVWMENGRTLEYYLIRNGDTLEYKNKIRSLRVRTLDGGAVKTIFVDESQPISQLMVVICSKMGIANHEEYSLVRGFSITFDGTDENSYGHGQHHQIQRNDRERTPYANGIDQHLYEGEIRGQKGKGVLENAFMNTIGRKKEKQIQQLRVKLHTEEEIHWVDHSKTLREQNIGDDEELTLRRKFFFSDTNVDTRDPVQLNLLYIQCRDGVLRGFHPVCRDTAIRLAALQCYIEYGPFEEGIQKNVDLKNLLPKEYSRAKELEKNIIQEYRELIYEDSAAPKKKYCELCQSLPTMVEDIVAPAMDAHEECQRALVETIEATIRAVEEAEEEIVKPHIDLPRFGETQRHWRVEVKKESVGDRLAAMGVATAEVVQLTAIPEESTVDTRLGNATATIGANLPEMGRGVRELAALMPDEHRVDDFFNEDSKFFNVFGNFLDKVHPEHQEKRANILSAASRVGELSNDVLSTIQDRTKDEISFYDEFEMKVQPLATSTPHLFLRKKTFLADCEDPGLKDQVIQSAMKTAYATSELVPCTSSATPHQNSSIMRKKRKRKRPNSNVLNEVRKYKKSTQPMIPQSPFSNLFKEILRNVSAPGSDLKVERKAINALHESTEAFMDKFFDAANRCAIHARRETVKPEDFSLVRWILDAFGINTLR